jgi:hypothetical protein
VYCSFSVERGFRRSKFDGISNLNFPAIFFMVRHHFPCRSVGYILCRDSLCYCTQGLMWSSILSPPTTVRKVIRRSKSMTQFLLCVFDTPTTGFECRIGKPRETILCLENCFFNNAGNLAKVFVLHPVPVRPSVLGTSSFRNNFWSCCPNHSLVVILVFHKTKIDSILV